MSEIKIFSTNGRVVELVSKEYSLESELQRKIENNMNTFFQVDFLFSEYSFNGGRIDSLGIDENNSPVIFEYKRSLNKNVINQGLFYLEWLLDHKADFEILVRDRFGIDRAESIEWSNPIVYCIASEFTRYDVNAVKQMQRNIRLVEYKRYNNILLFDFLNLDLKVSPLSVSNNKKYAQKTIEDRIEALDSNLSKILLDLKNYIMSLSDEVSEVMTKQYIAYKKVNNFVTIDATKSKIQIYLSISPKDIIMRDNMRDVSNIGHFGTGDVEIAIRDIEDFKMSLEYIDLAYRRF